MSEAATTNTWNLTNPANAITGFRILSTPFVLILLANTQIPSWLVCGLWFLVSISDFFDGIVARRYGTTRSGAYLDPLADKISVLGAMIVFVARDEFWWFPVALIAAREVAMSWYRTRVAREGVSVPARRWGKVKTFVQACSVGFVLFPPTSAHVPWLGNAALWAGVVLAYFSGIQYARDAMFLARAKRVR